ncbi:21778_t:CDS:2, partial [Racocetra persica]
KVEGEKKLIESDKEERMDFDEVPEDSGDEPLDDVISLIEDNTESIGNYNSRSVVINDQLRNSETIDRNSPIFDAQEFIKVIESQEPKLKGLFNAFFLAINPEGKNQQTKELTIQIPSATSIPQIAHMATILFNTEKTPPILFYSQSGFLVHNSNSVDSVLLKTILWEQYIISFANSYNFEKINWKWIHDIIFANESELIESLVVYSYDANIFERYRCQFDQTKLIDLIELDLKNMNNYIEAIKTFIGVMKRLNQHNYDKILLAFISNIHYWKLIRHSIIDILRSHLNTFDEYPVENFHSLLQYHTNIKVNTAKSLRYNALFIDNLQQNNDFIESFVPKRNYPYTKKDLDELVKVTAIFFLDLFENI